MNRIPIPNSSGPADHQWTPKVPSRETRSPQLTKPLYQIADKCQGFFETFLDFFVITLFFFTTFLVAVFRGLVVFFATVLRGLRTVLGFGSGAGQSFARNSDTDNPHSRRVLWNRRTSAITQLWLMNDPKWSTTFSPNCWCSSVSLSKMYRTFRSKFSFTILFMQPSIVVHVARHATMRLVLSVSQVTLANHSL